jgi:hypothetical protein
MSEYWLQKEAAQSDNYFPTQAQSYTTAVQYDTGVPRCHYDNEALINQRCVAHRYRFPQTLRDLQLYKSKLTAVSRDTKRTWGMFALGLLVLLLIFIVCRTSDQ